MENGPVCPGEHAIRKIDDVSYYTNETVFHLTCDGVIYNAAKFITDVMDQTDIDIWVRVANREHLIDYLQKEVLTLRERVTD